MQRPIPKGFHIYRINVIIRVRLHWSRMLDGISIFYKYSNPSDSSLQPLNAFLTTPSILSANYYDDYAFMGMAEIPTLGVTSRYVESEASVPFFKTLNERRLNE